MIKEFWYPLSQMDRYQVLYMPGLEPYLWAKVDEKEKKNLSNVCFCCLHAYNKSCESLFPPKTKTNKKIIVNISH